MVDKFCKDVKEKFPQKDAKKNANYISCDDDSDGSGVLEFIDPVAVEKAKLAEARANKDDKNQMATINGKQVAANSVSLNAGGAS